ncbi:MAG: hypothetical protein A2015_04665 [Spirochaetes bacterium GWF1_31_7]|nr:MAG: hypothetical protein A2Y30_05045 [Spirochaetes bacterium GWE1_32_154]OHD48761.1 MAG: hypothetical protein A2Y29_03020 [Spirochaetes bacterium GWE2_31_10]OHD52824.1 MAG: hypothetical protein A2015_04665 [Spirochaetes bacterium GWF1_31_7]OHD76243.1 MAG: hypothetical protein A2355_07750 [Spirochaetes bacterium RIFOXYB1_FULL_32_8]HBD95198.1 hypothetical protein [Spirochaetia bacterium]
MRNQLMVEIYKRVNLLNAELSAKKIDSVDCLKKSYIKLKEDVFLIISKDPELEANQDLKGKVVKVINDELDNSYQISYSIFKKFFWGEFEKLNEKSYPELWSILVDKDGELHRVFDDFPVTIAMMDFHGYTKFSNDIKYNKTPLMEFGEGLPAKIQEICRKCHSFVYEIEGDSLIIIGPENPYFVMTAVVSIIELAKQKTLFQNSNLKAYYNIELKNPMIKKFEMNAAITTGGQVFINNKGSLIGAVISEASRILKIINMKKPEMSGVIISDKIHRNMERFKNEPGYFFLSPNSISNPYLVDVKGMRLKIREFFIEDKKYVKICDGYTLELYKLMKLKNPSKWYNIIIIYTKMVVEVLKTVSVNLKIDRNEYTGEGLVYMLEEYMVRWINRPTPDIARKLIDIINKVYLNCNDVKDVIAIYYEFVNDNFSVILSRLDNFYENTLLKEKEKNRKLKILVDEYSAEIDNLKTRYFPRRMFETLLSNSTVIEEISDIPYIGKR